MPPNPPRKLTVLVAGAGLIGRRPIELMTASPSCAPAAIVDPALGAADIARNAGVPLYTTLDELFARSRPDGVVIATPNQFHVANALACIEAGVAALVEKPVAPTVEEGVRLCEAVERADAKVLVGHHRAHSPIMAKARAIVQEGTLGSLVAAMGSAMFYKPDHYFDEGP